MMKTDFIVMGDALQISLDKIHYVRYKNYMSQSRPNGVLRQLFMYFFNGGSSISGRGVQINQDVVRFQHLT